MVGRVLHGSGLERREVEDEAVFYVGLDDPLPGLLELVEGSHLDVGDDVVFAAEVEHLLGLLDTADGGAGEAFATEGYGKGVNLERGLRYAYGAEGRVALEQGEVGSEIVRSGDAVEDEVEGAGV